MPLSYEIGPNGSGPVNFVTPDQINIVFYAKMVPDPVASKTAGRPQFKNEDYVRVQHPGERDYTDSPVSDKPHMVAQFSRQWEAYQKSREYVPEGTPLELLFVQDAERHISANLRSNGIHTVEQLSNLNANGITQVGLYAQHYVNHARKYLDSAAKGVGFHQLNKELAARDNEIEVLKNNQRLLQAQLERLLAEKDGKAQQTFLSVEAQAPLATQAAAVRMQQQGGGQLPAPPWMQAAQAAGPAYAENPATAPQIALNPPQPQGEPQAKKRGGWPKGKPRTARTQSTEG